MAIIYLNGEWLDESQAKVSVFDRGFLFADAVYEVIPAYAGNYFRFAEHIERLNRSLAQIKMDYRLELDTWLTIADELLQKNGLKNAGLYLQVTRGTYATRSHDLPQNLNPTVVALVSELPPVYAEDRADPQGVKAITADDIRWNRCDIKTTGLLANCLLLQQALESGADDTILVRKSKAIEATASNLFMVKNGQVITPPLGREILAGVTRDFVILLVRQLGFELIEREIQVVELAKADEIWLTSSNKEIRPVVELNHAKIGTGSVGEVWRQVNKSYQQLKYDLYRGQFSEIEGI
ncbi:MAG: D-amino acid aminotransferase [Gammaproteobacteria bacterium]|nr:D-amino acid aminotransferase [Gammaproteobacteria bacterium]